MNNYKKAKIAILFFTLLFGAATNNVFALDPGLANGENSNVKTTSHASIGYKYTVDHVSSMYDQSQTATGPDGAITGGTRNRDSNPDEVLDYDHRGTIAVDVSYSTTGGQRLIDGNAQVYISGNNLGDVWKEGDDGNYYKLDDNGNVVITTAKGNGFFNSDPMVCTILSGAGNTLEAFHKSINDCAGQMQTWTGTTEISSTAGGVAGEKDVAQFENTPIVNIDGQITQLEGDGKSHQAHIDAAAEQGDAARAAYRESEEAAKASERACYSKAGPLGWVICPVIETIANFSEFFYESIVEPQLQIQASGIMSTSGGTYEAWSIFRDIANIIFAILFLLVVFSQITGFGIDNYGIKRMLPRLIIAAILINLSFFICQIAVDLANIIGVSIGNFISNIQNAGETLAGATENEAGRYQFYFGPDIIIGTAAVMALGLGTVLLVLCSAVAIIISLIFMYIILIARQSAVVIFVAISPLALVFYLFPNTEPLTKKWLKAFEAMLLLYPICALVISGGQLAGGILASAASGIDDTGMVIAAMLVHVVPYLAIPTLVKSSMSGIGNLGAKIQGFGDNLGRRASKGLAGSTAVKNATTRLNNIDPGGLRNKLANTKFGAATGFRRRRMQQMAAENELRSEGLKYDSVAATNKDLKDEKYQKMQQKAFDKQRLADNAKVWASHYEGKSSDEMQKDLVSAMRSNDANSGQIEGIIDTFMKNEDFGGLQDAMALAKTGGADEDAMQRAAEAMKDNRGFGRLSAKKPSLGEWSKDPSNNLLTSMYDNVAKFKPKDWASMDGKEVESAKVALEAMKYKAEHSTDPAEAAKAARGYKTAMNTILTAVNNPGLQGDMSHSTVEGWKDFIRSNPSTTTMTKESLANMDEQSFNELVQGAATGSAGNIIELKNLAEQTLNDQNLKGQMSKDMRKALKTIHKGPKTS